MTANVLPDQIAVARRAGMVDVIHKPFSAGEIFATLERVLGGGTGPVAEGAAPRTTPAEAKDAAILARLAGLIGDAKVKALLASLATSLAGRFDADPGTPEGVAALKRQAHASVAGSGMLGFTAFAATCKAFETAPPEACHDRLLADLRAHAATVIATAAALAGQDDPLTAVATAA